MRPADLALYRAPFLWRWLIERVWLVERAFESAKARGRAEDDTRLRIFFVLALFVAGFLTLGVGATRSALFADAGRGAGAALGPPGARADLVDRNGQLLALDLPHYGVYIDKREIWNTDETRRKLAAALPGLAPARLEAALSSDRRTYLIGGLTPQEKARVHDLGLPGVTFEDEDRRVYPLGTTAAHLIGFADRGGTGIAGAELALDDVLKSDVGKAPTPLSIDMRIQAALEDELDKAAVRFQALGGAGLVIDVHTGEILGMASYPTFDPNNLNASPDVNRKNNVAASVYEAGSVFKVFTVAMGLDAGLVTPLTTFDVAHPLVIGNSKPIHDYDKGDTILALPQVFTHSSNIGASKIALAAGSPTVDRYMKGLGLYNAAPSELAESTRPLLPRRNSQGNLSDITMAQMSFGQGISVTPLHVATAMTAIFNGGEYLPLTIRKQAPDAQRKGHRVISEATSRTMLDFMRLNVTEPKGSGKKADVPGLSVGGKTGTAQKAKDGRYMLNTRVASFAAVFPTSGLISDKRYFVYILLDEPHPAPGTFGFATAGFTAAPTAGAVINRIAPFLGVKRAAPPMTPPGPTAPAPVSGALGAD